MGEKPAAKKAAATKKAKAKAPAKMEIDLENPPKKVLTAYFHFSAANRGAIREANPDLKMGDIAKLLGEQWRELGDAEKAKFTTMAEKDKIRYAEEAEAFVAAGGILKGRKKTGGKKTKAKKVAQEPESEPEEESDE